MMAGAGDADRKASRGGGPDAPQGAPAPGAEEGDPTPAATDAAAVAGTGNRDGADAESQEDPEGRIARILRQFSIRG